MYIMARGESAWLCPTAADAWNSHALQIRLHDITNFVDFQQQLDIGKHVQAGVIKVYKCSDAAACETCALVTGCELLRMA